MIKCQAAHLYPNHFKWFADIKIIDAPSFGVQMTSAQKLACAHIMYVAIIYAAGQIKSFVRTDLLFFVGWVEFCAEKVAIESVGKNVCN